MITREEWHALLDDLDSHRLEVCLVPSRFRDVAAHGGSVRVVTGTNAGWYQDLCAAHPSNRRHQNAKGRTRIKRAEVRRILSRLAAGLPVRSVYLAHLTRAALAERVPF